MIISGFLLVPLFPLAIVFNSSYWNPVRIAGGVFGIEDILFAFIAGSITWAGAIWPLHKLVSAQIRIVIIIKRALMVHAISATLFLCLWNFGVQSLTSHIIQQLTIAVMILLLRRDLWMIAVTGSIGCIIGYGTLISIFFIIWPEFLAQWNLNSIWALSFFGLPLGEIIWAATFGMGWPLCVAYVCEVEFLRSVHIFHK